MGKRSHFRFLLLFLTLINFCVAIFFYLSEGWDNRFSLSVYYVLVLTIVIFIFVYKYKSQEVSSRFATGIYFLQTLAVGAIFSAILRAFFNPLIQFGLTLLILLFLAYVTPHLKVKSTIINP